MKRRWLPALVLLALLLTAGCASTTAGAESAYDTEFSNRDREGSWEGAVSIRLNGTEAEIDGSGAAIQEGVLTISQEGTYALSGELEGQVAVAVSDQEKVQLVLNGASIHCEDNAAIYISGADKVFVTLAEGTENFLSGGAEYDQTMDEGVDGVIFSRADLALNGSGSLAVTSEYRHAVVSKDDLIVTGGNYCITSAYGGLYGKDCVKILNGTFVLKTGTDAIQSSNAEDESRGFVYIAGGNFSIEAGTDGIQAETAVLIAGGTFDIATGGASASVSAGATGGWGENGRAWGPGARSFDAQASSGEASESAKGLKAQKALEITGGEFVIDSADDALHSNGTLRIAGGSLRLSSGDDGLHADGALEITGGTIEITRSYEGVEGLTVTISGGELSIVASDDGVNAAGGTDTLDASRPGRNGFLSEASEDAYIRVLGGTITIDASGDGMDSNGSIFIEGGSTFVSGAANAGNGAIDYARTAQISGGIFAAAGMSGMAQGFSSASGQAAALVSFSSTTSEAVSVTDRQGNLLLSYQPPKEYNSLLVNCPQMTEGESCVVSAGSQTQTISLSGATTYSGNLGQPRTEPHTRWRMHFRYPRPAKSSN